jgi:hypothetical protein
MVTNSEKSYEIYNAGTSYTVGKVVIYLNQLYLKNVSSTPVIPTDAYYWSSLYDNQAKSSAISPTNQAKS